MKFINNVWVWLQGKKTYITSVVAIAVEWVQVLNGTTTTNVAINMTLGAVIAMCIRHGVSTEAAANVGIPNQQQGS